MIPSQHRCPVSAYAFPGLRFPELTPEQLLGLRQYKKQPDHVLIMVIVCQYYGISSEVLKSGLRKRKVTWPRQVYCYLCSHLTKMSLKAIGETIGNRDHTTILHSKKLVKDLTQTDDLLRLEIRELQEKIKETLPHEP